MATSFLSYQFSEVIYMGLVIATNVINISTNKEMKKRYFYDIVVAKSVKTLKWTRICRVFPVNSTISRENAERIERNTYRSPFPKICSKIEEDFCVSLNSFYVLSRHEVVLKHSVYIRNKNNILRVTMMRR